MKDHMWTARPIAEAPKDRPILCHDPDHPWHDGYFLCGWAWARNRPIEEGRWMADDLQTGDHYEVNPTVWWELPEPPA